MTAVISSIGREQMPDKRVYVDTLTFVERLHRRLLDVAKDEFGRKGRTDISPV